MRSLSTSTTIKCVAAAVLAAVLVAVGSGFAFVRRFVNLPVLRSQPVRPGPSLTQMDAKLFLALGVTSDTDTSVKCSTDRADVSKAASLLGKGANSNARLLSGYTPIMVAAMEDDAACIQLLLRNHADVNARGPSGVSALALAVQSRSRDVVSTLLKSGADVNSREMGGLTPLMRAVMSRDAACVQMLIDSGADVTLRDNDRMSALDWELKSSPSSRQIEDMLTRALARRSR